jgi:signal transduction histidine kinase
VLLSTLLAAIPTGVRLNSALTTLHLPDERWSLADLRGALTELGIADHLFALFVYLSSVALGLVLVAVAGLLVWRKPHDRGALTIASLLALSGWATTGTHLILESLYPEWQVFLRALGITAFSCLTLVLYVFPDGSFVPRWTRWPALVTMLMAPLNALDSPLSPLNWPAPLSVSVGLISIAIPLVSQAYRYRVRSNAQQRQQTKWVALSVVIFAVGSAPVLVASWLAPELSAPGVRGLQFHLVSNTWLALLTLLLPIAITVAVLRLRLWDVDPLLNRTLVYGILTLLAGTVYIVTSGLLSAVFQTPGNVVFSLLAAGVIAVLFEPGRRLLQRTVNRLMYGERDDPYLVLTRLAQRLEGAPPPEAVLTTITHTVREAFRAPYAAIELSGSAGDVLTSVQDPPGQRPNANSRDSNDVCLSLAYRGEPVGSLIVAARRPGESFSSRDRRLLDDLGRHVGTAVFAVRAATELQLARERLVTASHEERRRLRRELHDGLGPLLATLTMKLDAALGLIADDPARSQALVAEVQSQLQDTLTVVRRLVYTLYPPVLDELGLPTAIREQASSQLQAHGVAVDLELPPHTGPLPAAAEVAAFYIAVEAMTNIKRHARASNCRLRLATNRDKLELDITDDGCGVPAGTRRGVGLHSMRERAQELGGSFELTPASPTGTRIHAALPLGPVRS